MNHQDEVMDLYMGYNLINFKIYREIIVIGDSKLLITGVRKQCEYGHHNLF
jgi:hypothetical protein